MNLAAIPEGHYEQDFVCDTELFKNMECADVISADVAVHLDLEYRHGAYDCNFTLRGMMQIPCDRCLDPMDHPVDTHYHVTVHYGDEYSDEADEVLTIPHTDDTLNVAYLLYDTLMLSIPMRHVHPQGHCNRNMASALHRHSPTGDEAVDEALDEADCQDDEE